MTTFLMVRGMEPIMLADEESFNKTRQRINQVITNTNRDGSPRKGKEGSKPLHEVTFYTVDEDGMIGRFAPVPSLIQGVGSDQRKDGEEDDD